MPLVIELIDDLQRFELLRGEWEVLLQASAANGLFLTWEWLATWWRHFSVERELFVLTARAGGDLMAIAPFSLRRWRLGASVEFLGTGSVGSDYLDLIVRRGCEREVVHALGAYLARESVILDMAQVRRDGSVAALLAAELTRRGWRASETRAGVCPYIPLDGLSWSDYLATLGPAHRSNVRRRLRNAMKRFEMRFEQARSASEVADALVTLVRLHHMRWRERGGSDGLHTPALLAFHGDVSQLARERGWLRLFVLSLDGRPAAALYGFCYGQTFYFYQSGFDPEHGRYSVGLLATGLAIRAAIEEGAREYDLLHGDEEYKFRWARRTRELSRLELYPPRLRATLYRRARTLSRAAMRLARAAISEPRPTRRNRPKRVGPEG